MWSMLIFVYLAVMPATNARLLRLCCDHVKDFVDFHNKIRFDVYKGKVLRQPAAPEMKTLAWSDELANLAETRLSDTVDYSWPIQLNETEKVRHGANKDLADCPGGKINVGSIMEPWNLEHVTYKFQSFDINRQRRGGTDFNEHYTQIVWESTSEFGCGIYQIENDDVCVVLCYYSPKGNNPGELPYAVSRKPGLGKELPCSNKCSDMYGKYCTSPLLQKSKKKKKKCKNRPKKKKESSICTC